MIELYWLTRLEYLHNFLVIIMAISSCITCFSFIIWIMSTKEEETQKIWLWLKRCFITLSISSVISIFIPSTKEALLIWGVGSTIDYIQENETAKQLPDKCINALNDWVDSLSRTKEK